MAAKTTFVIVPGAWHPAVTFEAFARRLEGLGYQVRVVDHKSVGAEPPLKNFDPDVEQVRDVIEEEAAKGQDVVVFMHSYGGMVGTEACRGLSKKDREAAGKTGGIVKLIYCSAFMVPDGRYSQNSRTTTPAPPATEAPRPLLPKSFFKPVKRNGLVLINPITSRIQSLRINRRQAGTMDHRVRQRHAGRRGKPRSHFLQRHESRARCRYQEASQTAQQPGFYESAHIPCLQRHSIDIYLLHQGQCHAIRSTGSHGCASEKLGR